MSIFRGLSKEFQVGALTSVAITVLILGYNFMRGKDNPFKAGTDVYVFYDSAQGLGIGTSVMFNGLRIGQLSDLDITADGKRIQAIFEIKSSLNIPKDSKMEIQSQILGGQRVRLVMGNQTEFIQDGDTLIGDYAHDQFSAINEQIVPLASKGRWVNKLWESNAELVYMPPNMKFIGGEDGVMITHRWRTALWAIGDQAVSILKASGIGKVR
jgi:phospholipid/cholesterol/gamma-HCH transport system substrate-binding protein